MIYKELFVTDKKQIISNKKYSKTIFIYDIKLYKYFMRSHKLTRVFNRKLLEDYKEISVDLHISLLKFTDKIFFESARIIEIIHDYKEYEIIIVETKYNDIISFMLDILDIKINNIIFIDYKNNKKFTLKYHFYSIILFFNSFFVQKYSDQNIFIIYNDKIAFEFFKPYKNEAIVYPMYDKKLKFQPSNYHIDKYLNRKFITFNSFRNGIINFFNNKKLIQNSNLPKIMKEIYISKLLELEVQSMMILSLKDKFVNLKNIFGIFDTHSGIDYITKKLNKDNIKTICIPHGINFKYKVSYISYGTNIYTLWSKNHYERMEESYLLKNENVKKIITGNIVYTNTLKKFKNKSLINNKKILVIGEYFANDNFYSSPFNKESSKLLFDELKIFSQLYQDVEITIRTRLSDGYYELSQKYISDSIKLSSPKKSIIDEINEHDLIISVFSNALHEGLLLNKKVLQVNLLEIENYRDLAKDNLVYYADTVDKLKNILKNWYKNNLPKLDFQKHLDKYANHGKFKTI